MNPEHEPRRQQHAAREDETERPVAGAGDHRAADHRPEQVAELRCGRPRPHHRPGVVGDLLEPEPAGCGGANARSEPDQAEEHNRHDHRLGGVQQHGDERCHQHRGGEDQPPTGDPVGERAASCRGDEIGARPRGEEPPRRGLADPELGDEERPDEGESAVQAP